MRTTKIGEQMRRVSQSSDRAAQNAFMVSSEVALTIVDWFSTEETLGFLAAGLVFLSFSMRTMLSLRVIAVASNIAFIAYALRADLTPILVLHGSLLPLNLFRLLAMWRDVKDFDGARSDDDFLALAPLGERLWLKPGDVLFRKGERADAMFIVIDGEIDLVEIGVIVGRGALIGEIGLYSRARRRTASARAVGRVRLSKISAEATRKLFFDNPHLADRLTRLITERLIMRLEAAESGLAQFADAPEEARRPAVAAERRVGGR